jgi:hypothetical protein
LIVSISLSSFAFVIALKLLRFEKNNIVLYLAPCEMTFVTSLLRSLEKGNVPEDVNTIFQSLKFRYINDTQNNCESDSIVMAHIKCVNLFNNNKCLNSLFGLILQYGYGSESKKAEIGISIYGKGETRQIKLEPVFSSVISTKQSEDEIITKWTNIIFKAMEPKEKPPPNTTPDTSIANTVAAARPPTPGIRATKKARLEFMSPTMCYSCVVNLCDRRKAQLKSIVLQFARSMFPREDNGVDAFEQMHQLVQAVPEQDKLMGAMQTLYNKGDKLAQKQIGAALRQQGYQHGEVQTILGCHINKRKFGIFGSPNECVRGSPNKSMPRRLQYTSVVVDQFVKYLIESGYKLLIFKTWPNG